MSFNGTSTHVIRATEPSVVLGHHNKDMLKLCERTEEAYKPSHYKHQNLTTSSIQCSSLWAESLGTRSTMGKILLKHQNN